MKPKELQVVPAERGEVKEFIEQHHYSRSINGVKVAFCFRVMFGQKLVGAVLFGALSTTGWKRYAATEKEVVELRRLVLADDAERGSESYVIGRCLRWIRRFRKDIRVVVSYADPAYGHSGVIYRASNFVYDGTSAKDTGFKDPETGKVYHSRALKTRGSNGLFKPFVLRLRELNARGKLEKIKLPGKHRFFYRLW